MVRSSTRDSCTRGQSGGAERGGEAGRRREQPGHSSQEAAHNWATMHMGGPAPFPHPGPGKTDRQTDVKVTHIRHT